MSEARKQVMSPQMDKWVVNDMTRLSIMQYQTGPFFYAVISIERLINDEWKTFNDEQWKVFASTVKSLQKWGDDVLVKAYERMWGPHWREIMPVNFFVDNALYSSEW